MDLKNYTIKELRSELKRRGDLAKAEKNKNKKMQNVQALG